MLGCFENLKVGIITRSFGCRKLGILRIAITGILLFYSCFIYFGHRNGSSEAVSDTVKVMDQMKLQPLIINSNKRGLDAVKVMDQMKIHPLTIHCNGGRLGNQMCTFAVLQGLGALNKREINILPCNKKLLDPVFEISVTEVNMSLFVEHKPYSIGPFRHPEDVNISNETNIIKGCKNACSFTFFHNIRQEITKTFHFKEKFRAQAQRTLEHAKGNRTNVTFVGVHVRRGDYAMKNRHTFLYIHEGREVDLEYFHRATTYFKEKYSNVTFVVVSDDLEWCQENLKNFSMYIQDKPSTPAYDMALLAQCNHTVMTYGTFGFWGAYLAGGEVVYFDKFLKPGTSYTKNIFLFDKVYPPEWVGISTTKPGFWDTYERPTFL